MPLRMLHVTKCRPGLVVGRAVVDDDGGVVVAQHACLTKDTLEALAAGGHDHLILEVDDSFAAGQERVDEEYVKKGLGALIARGVPPPDRVPELGRRAAADLNVTYRSPAVAALFGERENLRGLIARTIVSEFKPQVLAALVEIKMANAALYVHALTCAVAAALIARAVGVPEHRTRQLIAGTLLQDLGLIYLPTDMPAEERLRIHPLLGHRLLREMKYVEALAAHVALEHHEFTDGTGQPRGVIGQNALSVSRWSLPPLPTLIGEIAAVANVYAQLAGKGRREAVTPDAAIAELRKQAGVKLNKAIVSEFLRATPIFPAGTRVIVRGGARDGFRGRVNAVNASRLDRPVVILERDSKNKEIEPFSMDLMQDKKSRLETRPW